jgi:hypothetical protein
MIGQPMDASGFRTLASHFPDSTVITYDPRGLVEASAKTAGSTTYPASTRAASQSNKRAQRCPHTA